MKVVFVKIRFDKPYVFEELTNEFILFLVDILNYSLFWLKRNV